MLCVPILSPRGDGQICILGGGEVKAPPSQAGAWPVVGMCWPGGELLNEITYFDYVTTWDIVIPD